MQLNLKLTFYWSSQVLHFNIINQHQNQTISKANKKQHTIGVYTTGVHVKRHRERKRETKSLLRRSALHCKGEIDQESIAKYLVERIGARIGGRGKKCLNFTCIS